MSLSKEELVLTACFLKSMDMSISMGDAIAEAQKVITLAGL